MFDALNASASGLEAAQTLITVAAQDLANVNTSSGSQESVQLVDVPGGGGGVDVLSITADLSSNASDAADSAVKLTEDLRKAEVLYAANAAAINIQNQTFGNLINMLDTDQTQSPDQDSDNVP